VLFPEDRLLLGPEVEEGAGCRIEPFPAGCVKAIGRVCSPLCRSGEDSRRSFLQGIRGCDRIVLRSPRSQDPSLCVPTTAGKRLSPMTISRLWGSNCPASSPSRAAWGGRGGRFPATRILRGTGAQQRIRRIRRAIARVGLWAGCRHGNEARPRGRSPRRTRGQNLRSGFRAYFHAVSVIKRAGGCPFAIPRYAQSPISPGRSDFVEESQTLPAAVR